MLPLNGEPPDVANPHESNIVPVREQQMTVSGPIPSDKRIVAAMIELARISKSHRMVLAGCNSSAILLELQRRSYLRVTTARLCGVACGQFDVAFVVWRENSRIALETTLAGVVKFLSAGGVLVAWADARERAPNKTLRLALRQFGFRIEAGTVCENGVAICARRLESNSAALAA
jgi:hypothetical protein